MFTDVVGNAFASIVFVSRFFVCCLYEPNERTSTVSAFVNVFDVGLIEQQQKEISKAIVNNNDDAVYVKKMFFFGQI